MLDYHPSTKRISTFAINKFEEYLHTINTTLAMVENLPQTELDNLLSQFYSSTRSQSKGFYSAHSMKSIRYGLHLHFRSVRNIDITSYIQFNQSNDSFDSMMSLLEQQGKETKKKPILQKDMDKIQSSLDMNVPQDLRDKVFMDILMIFPKLGRESLREMTPDSFLVLKQEDGRRFVMIKDASLTADAQDVKGKERGVMKELPGNAKCPVASFLKYKGKLNPASSAFWQRPKTKEDFVETDDVWYYKEPIGAKTLGGRMKAISLRAGTSQVYTNKNLALTSVDILGYE